MSAQCLLCAISGHSFLVRTRLALLPKPMAARLQFISPFADLQRHVRRPCTGGKSFWEGGGEGQEFLSVALNAGQLCVDITEIITLGMARDQFLHSRAGIFPLRTHVFEYVDSVIFHSGIGKEQL